MGSVDLSSSLAKGTDPFLLGPSEAGPDRGGAYIQYFIDGFPKPLSCCIFCEVSYGLRSQKSGVPRDRTAGTEPGRRDNSRSQSASLACRAENHNNNRRTGSSRRLGLAAFSRLLGAL